MLGHNLGLRDGGTDQVPNKPNYLSVMNPMFQMMGLYKGGEWHFFDYSRWQLNTLDENNLNEVKGLGTLPLGYGTTYWCPNYTPTGPVPADAAIDWNCDQQIKTGVKADVNWDKQIYTPQIFSHTYTTLVSFNDWSHINFSGGGVIGK